MSLLRATFEQRRIWIFRLSPTNINKPTQPKRVQYTSSIYQYLRVICELLLHCLANMFVRASHDNTYLFTFISLFQIYLTDCNSEFSFSIDELSKCYHELSTEYLACIYWILISNFTLRFIHCTSDSANIVCIFIYYFNYMRRFRQRAIASNKSHGQTSHILVLCIYFIFIASNCCSYMKGLLKNGTKFNILRRN